MGIVEYLIGFMEHFWKYHLLDRDYDYYANDGTMNSE